MVRVDYRSGTIQTFLPQKAMYRMNSNSVRRTFATTIATLIAFLVYQTRSAQSSSATTSEATAEPLLQDEIVLILAGAVHVWLGDQKAKELEPDLILPDSRPSEAEWNPGRSTNSGTGIQVENIIGGW
jgi:hypothetical protein